MTDSFGAMIDAELAALRVTYPQLVGNLIKNDLDARPVLTKIVRLNPSRIEDGPAAWHILLTGILDAARIFNPTNLKAVRAAAQRADELSEEIECLARQLSKALYLREDICDRHQLNRPSDAHPVDLFDDAARIAGTASSYKDNVRVTLEALRDRHDSRCWPTTAAVIEALANRQSACHWPYDDVIATAVSEYEVSIRTFWRALHQDIATLQERYGINADLSAQDFVDLTNALLDHPRGCTLENFCKSRHTQHTPDN